MKKSKNIRKKMKNKKTIMKKSKNIRKKMKNKKNNNEKKVKTLRKK